MSMYLLGYDIGSSSVKASLVDGDSGKCLASAFYPKQEAEILAPQAGWAEQHPAMWWENLKLATADVLCSSHVDKEDIKAIGISYQMHGLVCVDKNQQVLRPAIIWCDSRAVNIGQKAFNDLGANVCLSHLLNSPGNFTASKLAWVKLHEPKIFEKIDKFMLPGDYIAMKMTGNVCTTISGLSEGMFWDFKNNKLADFLLDYYGIDSSMIADIVPTFGNQGTINKSAAQELGLKEGTLVSYRAGDQPNNALSLNVFNPGEIAATAGTSGVVYGVTGKTNFDPLSRVNTFAHVNHTNQLNRLGILLCINGTGILNSWMHHQVTPGVDYPDMDRMASSVPVGSDGLVVMPFGNGAERVLQNKELGCSIHGLNFNKHEAKHILRASQEGIVFSFCYGMEIMKQMGLDIQRIHAGRANMFKSALFCDTLATVSGAIIDVYKTDGSVGAAKGAGLGAGVYGDHNEAFASLECQAHFEPQMLSKEEYYSAYQHWKTVLNKEL